MPDVFAPEIPDGNSLRIKIDWRDADGILAAPSSIVYRVCDAKSGEIVAPARNVPSPAQSMTIDVPGEDLPYADQPNGITNRRRLAIALEADFSEGDRHTELIFVSVRKGY